MILDLKSIVRLFLIEMKVRWGEIWLVEPV